MQQIERGIYYEDSYLGVTLGAIVLNHGTILIDAPLRVEDARSWRASLLNTGSSTNRILVSLDAHPDRTLGARTMDCPIVAHQRTAQIFRNRPSVFKGQVDESGAEWEMNNELVGTRWASPDLTFSQRMYIHWGQPEVVLEHHSGPSPGAIWVIIPSARVIFVGDVIMRDQPPFLAQADLQAWIEALDVLHTSFRNYVIVSGRDGPVPIETVRAQQRYLKNIRKGLERLAKRNSPPEMTENLVQGLLSGFSLLPTRREQYIQRLRHGLYNCYARHYYRQVENTDEE